MFELKLKRGFHKAGRLILIRHGETDDNANGVMLGHTDTPLNERGREQARGVASALPAFVSSPVILASDLLRAKETGETIAAELGQDIHFYPELREANFGALDGLSTESEKYKRLSIGRDDDKFHFRPQGGESYYDLSQRIDAFLIDQYSKIVSGRDVLLVAHGGVARALCYLFCQPNLQQLDYKPAYDELCVLNFDCMISFWGVPVSPFQVQEKMLS